MRDNRGGGEPPCVEPAALEPPEDGSLILHRLEVVDAANVELLADGTVYGKIAGCDFWHEFEGRWVAYEDAILVLPNPGEELEWFSWTEPALYVRLTSHGDGPILAEVVHESGPTTFMTLAEGRVCSCCQAGPLMPCPGPLTEEWDFYDYCGTPCPR